MAAEIVKSESETHEQLRMTLSDAKSLVRSQIEKHLTFAEVKHGPYGLLIVSRPENAASIRIRVTFSKDYLSHESLKDAIFQSNLRAIGWWTVKPDDVKQADFLAFVLFGPEGRELDYIIVPASDLLERLEPKSPAHSHLCVTKRNQCWEFRNLPREQRRQIAEGNYRGPDTRNFTRWLNNWDPLAERIS